ncbi:MAG: AAA family ATPase [Casimicrobium sp.]
MLSNQYVSRFSLKTELIESTDKYPFNLPALRNLDYIELHPKMTFFVGENGSGKSTLLEALAVSLGFNPEGGTKNFAFSTRESHSELHQYLRVAKGIKKPRDGFFLRAESFFNVATEIENLDEDPWGGPPIIDSYGGQSLHEQSHGESFMALLMNRFGGQGIYILDEPEAALSPTRQLKAITRIHELINDRSQFIIATHSPLMMAYPDAWIYACTAEGLKRVQYKDTEHFRVTRDFMANPDAAIEAITKANKS